MTVNITIDQVGSNIGSPHTSASGSDVAEGTRLSPHSVSESPEHSETSTDRESIDQEWAQTQHLDYPSDVHPSDSASRPRSSHRARAAVPRTTSSSRPSRRHSVRESGTLYRSRERAHHPPPESVDPAEFDVGYAARPGPPQRHSFYGGHQAGYAHSNSSGASYAQYPQVSHHPSSQLVTYPPQTMSYGQHYPHPQAQIAPPHAPQPTFYPQPHASPPPMGPFVGSPPIISHDMMPFNPGTPGYFQHFQQPYQIPHPAALFPYHHPPPPHRPSPSHAGTPPPEPPKDPPKEDNKENTEEIYKRFEKMLADQEAERRKREDEKEAEIKRQADAKKAAEERAASDKKIAEDAAAQATAAAEEAAAKKAAEEAEKAKKALEEAAEKAEAEKAAAVAAAQPPPPPPEDKKAPIKFKDAVGRKFSFPFHLCAKWQGMEDLIRQAFIHVDVIGPHVADGHYDLVGPNGDIILPQVWETVIEPDWTITMHMWPMPEKPKTPDLPPLDDSEVLVLNDVLAPTKPGGKKPPTGAPKNSIPPPPPPPPPSPPRRGSLPPLAPDVPKPNGAAKKAGSKPKPKTSGWGGIFGSRPTKPPAKPVPAKTKAKK